MPRRAAVLWTLGLALAGVASWLTVPGGSADRDVPRPPEPLRVGTVESPILLGERHLYSLDLGRVEALTLELEQQGLDLALTVTGPGQSSLRSDNPWDVERPERLTWVGREAGRVIVRVEALDTPQGAGKQSGRYRLRVPPTRTATREDFAANRGYRAYQVGRELEIAERFVEARSAYRRSAGLFARAGAIEPETWCWKKIGLLSEKKLGDPRREELAYRKLVAVERSLGEGALLASALNSLAGVLARKSEADLTGSIRLYQEARSLLEAQVSPAGPSRLLLSLLGEASGQYGNGRAHVALGLYRRAAEMARSMDDSGSFCVALLGVSRVLYRSGDTDGALRACDECLERTEHGWVLHEKGSLLITEGQPEEGLRYLERAAAADPRLRRLSLWYQDRGRALGRLGAAREADAAFVTALRLGPTSSAIEQVWIDRAYALDAAGRHESALVICRDVLGRSLEGSDPLVVTGAHHCLARNLAALGRREKALEHIDIAVGRVEGLRGDLAQDRLRSLFLASRREYYELYIELLLDEAEECPDAACATNFHARVVDVSEALKARTLAEGLARDDFEAYGDVEELERKRAVEAKITELEIRLVSRTGKRTEKLWLEAELRRWKSELDRLRGALRALRPGWEQASSLEPAALETIQAELLAEGDTQMLGYFLGDELSVAWVISSGRVVAKRLPPRDEIERIARRVTRGFAEARTPWELAQAKVDATQLARMVITPIAPTLDRRRLVLLAEGALAEVSFAALPDLRSAEGAYLSDLHEIVQTHSASTALALRRPRSWRPKSNRRMAIVGDGVFRCDDDRLPGTHRCQSPAGRKGKATYRGLTLDSLPRLPGTGVEARAIAEMDAVEDPYLLLGFDARADRILDGSLGPFGILHLATHGFSEPAASGLVFSRFDDQGREIESLVSEWQIYDLRFAADLVVLSACRSGRGEQITGEGAISLSRAFLWAGASTIVVSLWDVDDDATRFLMTRFYEELLESVAPPGEALRRAQKAVRDRPEWSAPRYWAGFVVQGDWR